MTEMLTAKTRIEFRDALLNIPSDAELREALEMTEEWLREALESDAAREQHIVELEADLRLNAGMLAHQCDLARQAETQLEAIMKEGSMSKEGSRAERLWRVDSGCKVTIKNVSNGYILRFQDTLHPMVTFYPNLDAVLIALRWFYEAEEP